jgi:hypothetical protein
MFVNNAADLFRCHMAMALGLQVTAIKKRGCPSASPRHQPKLSAAYGETNRKKPAGFTPGVLM